MATALIAGVEEVLAELRLPDSEGRRRFRAGVEELAQSLVGSPERQRRFNEAKNRLLEHPDVAQVAVVGVPDARWGEAVTAAVVLKTGASVTVQELVDLVKQSKGSVQAPKTVEFIAEIPLTSLGKPDKKALRARAAARAEFRDRV